MLTETDTSFNREARWKAERTKLTMSRRSRGSAETSLAYATTSEFCDVFTENMDSLHLFSFLLTADHTKAEECFVSGLEDCVKGSYVFRDWARSWARRTIIQNAVRMLAPHKNGSAGAAGPSDPVNCRPGGTREANAAIASILGLEDFERFVFVISVLERYSDQDCSILLGCSRQEIGETRMRALLRVAESHRRLALGALDSNDYGEERAGEAQMVPQL
jgi:hypothetical protein